MKISMISHLLNKSFTRSFSKSIMVSQQAKQKILDLVKTKPVFIASKTYCPYCANTKSVINQITDKAYVLELDTVADGSELQDALEELYGQRTVPNVFIMGEHVGGNSDVMALKEAGKLDAKIKAAL